MKSRNLVKDSPAPVKCELQSPRAVSTDSDSDVFAEPETQLPLTGTPNIVLTSLHSGYVY